MFAYLFPMSSKLLPLRWLALLAWSLAGAPAAAAQVADSAVAAPASDSAAVPSHALEDDRLFAEAARVAWRYVDQQYQPASGFINPVAWYPYATLWDIASGLAALYCGHGLNLLSDEEYDRRM